MPSLRHLARLGALALVTALAIPSALPARTKTADAPDVSAHPLKDRLTLEHARRRNVRVDVAAAEEDRRAVQRVSDVAPRRPGRTDEPAAQDHDAAVAPRLPRREFRREAGPLREPQQNDAVR